MSGAAANNPSLSAKSIACAWFGYQRKHVVRKFAVGWQIQGQARRSYRFNWKRKALALGAYPNDSLEKARAHQAAPRLLAADLDPSL